MPAISSPGNDVSGVTLATWNVESIRAHHDQVMGWVERRRPTLLCLQETRAGPRKFPTRSFVEAGYEIVVHGGDDGHGGVAMASRVGLDQVVTGMPGAVAPLAEPRTITATVPMPARPLRVHTCYGPNGRKVGTRHHEIKLAWLALFTAWIEIDGEDHPDRVVAGDLNVAPTDLDVWDPARYRRRNLTSPPERQGFESLMTRGKLVDVVRAELGEARGYTWWNRRGDFFESDRGWRLDHVLASKALASRVVAARIDRAERADFVRRDRPSTDHVPIIVELGSQ